MKVVFVCTANRARSPIAAAAFTRVTPSLPLQITSAGTHARVDDPPLREASAAARELGLDISSHRSRPLADVDLPEMDLIVTMDLNHSAFAVVELGAPVGKTFTLGELTRLLRESGDGWDKEDPSAVLRELHEKRRSRPLFVPGEDVPDPVGRPVDFHREVAGRVTQLVEEIAERLFTAGGAKP